jgi:hypothetical protein
MSLAFASQLEANHPDKTLFISFLSLFRMALKKTMTIFFHNLPNSSFIQ